NENHFKRLMIASLFIIGTGLLLFIFYPIVLENLLKNDLIYRAAVSFILIFPLGILLGIPFSPGLKVLKSYNFEIMIPWMYGVNGVMSVMGSILAVILSMVFGFTISFFVGLFFYLIIYFVSVNLQKKSAKI